MQINLFKKYIKTSIKNPNKNTEINYLRDLYNKDKILKFRIFDTFDLSNKFKIIKFITYLYTSLIELKKRKKIN